MNYQQPERLATLLVDNHPLFRLGLKQVLNREYGDIIVHEAEAAKAALSEIKRRSWNLIILALGLPDRHGLFVLEGIRAHSPAARVLIVLSAEESLHVWRAVQLGASGYISTNARASDLVKAVNCVLAGKRYFDKSISPRLISNGEALHTNLSPREYTVMLALATGGRNCEIATELKLNDKTVSTYKRRVLNKLQLNSTADLIRYAIAHNLSDYRWIA